MSQQNKSINPHFKVPLASQTPLQNSEPKFALNNLPLNKSLSVNKSVAITLQNLDDKECEPEQLDTMKPIIDINSKNHLKFLKLGAKVQTSNRKYNPPKNTSLFAQNQFTIYQSNNHSTNAISNMPRTEATKSTPTKARVTFSANLTFQYDTNNEHFIEYRDNSLYYCHRHRGGFETNRHNQKDLQQETAGNFEQKGRYLKKGARLRHSQ